MSDPRYAYPHPGQYAYPKKLQSEKCLHLAKMTDPKYAYSYPARYAYPNPAQGYYQGPPVMAPPPQYAAPPLGRESGFLDACRAALCCCGIFHDCCCCIFDYCCCGIFADSCGDPTITSFGC